jgi:SAM-dependent methyltransferase
MKTARVTDSFDDHVAMIYERHLVPLIFEPFARETAIRVASTPARRVLEIAAGTGVVTRALVSRLAPEVKITATDLSQAMLDRAQAVGTTRPVIWRQANAMALPFADAKFDAVVCQFGAMFFADKARAFAEARRLLAPGGVFLFSVWDRIEENELADEVTNSLGHLYPDDPPRFLRRIPHGYFDVDTIVSDLAVGGFANPEVETITARSQTSSALVPAMSYCEGTPLRGEIEARGQYRLADVTDVAANAIARRFSAGPIDAKIQAHLVTVRR